MSTLAIPSPDPSPTIRDRERNLENVLDRVRSSSEQTSAVEALSLLAQLRNLLVPVNLRCTVQLEEDGRKKRSTAAASNWSFENGEIVIYFEPLAAEGTGSVSSDSEPNTAQVLKMPAPVDTQEANVSSVERVELQQCCQALAEAEKGGKQFIALKWFRDLALAALQYPWTRTADDRQRVLSMAIDSGAIQIRKIPNPKSPMHPTTTVALNRGSLAVPIPSRFNPVPIKGEPASVTLLRDRGSY